MKELLKKILSTFLILITLSFVFVNEVSASEDVTIGKDEVIEGPYIKAGDNITISGTINGDAYVAGGVVTIDGEINGDLLVGGGVVTIKGKVENDVRAAGGMITIDGKVGRNVTALGGTVTFGSDTDIDGDVVVAGGTFAHLGNIDGKALIYSSDTTLGGRVGRDITVTAEKVSVLKTALLDGNLNYTADKEASVSAEARIVGAVKRTALTQVGSSVRKGLSGVRFGVNLLSYLSMLLLGLILLRVAPRQTTAVAKLIGEQPWKSMGFGFLGLVLAPVAIVILMISVVGVPLAAILTGAYILIISTSSLFTGLFVGQKVFDLINLKENTYAMLAVGLLLLQPLLALPTVGGLVRFFSVLVASGAVVVLGREAVRRLETRNP